MNRHRLARVLAFGTATAVGLAISWLHEATPADLPWWWPLGKAPEVTPEALAAELREQPPQLVDVRQPAEFNAGHIVGALNAPLPRLPALLPGSR